MSKAPAILLLNALLILPVSGKAETANDHFQVQLSVVPTCSVYNANQLVTGNLSTANIAADTKKSGSKLEVACSKGTSYDIGLSGKNEIRTIRSAHGTTAGYELFWDHDNNLDWDITSLISATGTGDYVTHRVNRRTPFALSLDNQTTTDVRVTDEITITFTF